MTDQPTGRALAEAAARAMGWKKLQGSETWDDGTFLRTMDQRPVDEREMLAWLHERGGVNIKSGRGWKGATQASLGWDTIIASCIGCDLRDALMRLVVAVAEREAKANG